MRAVHLSSLGVGDAGEAQVTLLPFGVEAVPLELPELKGGVEGPGLDLNGDGVDHHGHALHHLLRKAVLAANASTGGRHSMIDNRWKPCHFK